MAVLQTFIDDSGDEDSFVLGGFVASVEVWKKLSIDWVNICKESPSIEYYKSNEAIGRKECFQNLTPDERNQKVSRLASLLPAQECYGIAVYLSLSDFNEIKDLYSPIFKKIPFPYRFPYYDPYFMAAACMVSVIAINCDLFFSKIITEPNRQVEIFFDEQGKVGRQFRWFHDDYLRPELPRLGYCDHRNDKEFPPLQAADMMASWIRRGVSSRISMWSAADIFLSDIECRTIEIRREVFSGFINRLMTRVEAIEKQQNNNNL